MRRSAHPPVLEPEPAHVEVGAKPHDTAAAQRRRSAIEDRHAPHASTAPELHPYRTVLACSFDDDEA